MNNKGFTLIEFLIWLFGIIVFFFIALSMSRSALSTSAVGPVRENQVYAAAENYVIKENVPFNSDDYVCVTKSRLEKMGYLKKVDDTERIIKVSRSKVTKVINDVEYVNSCE